MIGFSVGACVVSLAYLGSIKVGKQISVERNVNGRQLGLLERWYSAHQGRGDRNICYVLKMYGNAPSLEIVIQAMKEVVVKHNGLHCQTVPSGNPKVEPIEVIWQNIPENSDTPHPWMSVIFEVDRVDDNTALEITQKLVNTNFNPEEPPWRIHIVRNKDDSVKSNFEIVISVNHLVADGISGMILCREFLSKLTEISDPTKQYSYSIPKDDFFAIEDIMDTRPKLFNTLSTLCKAYIFDRIGFIKKYKQVFVPMTDDKRCLETGPPSFGNLTEEKTKMLLQKCKEEKTTCHSALIAATHIVLAQFENELSPNSKRQNWKHNIETPINLRGYGSKSLPDNAIGVYISRAGEPSNISGTDKIWDIARSAQLSVKQSIPYSISILGMIQFVPNLVELLELEFKKNPGGRNASICLSNLGYQPIDLPNQYSDGSEVPWKVIGLNFTQQHHVGSGSSFMASIVTCANKLHISICSAQPVISQSWNNLILSRLLFTLETLSSSPSNITVNDLIKQ